MIIASILLALLTNASEVFSALQRGLAEEPFKITVTVTYQSEAFGKNFIVSDGSGNILLRLIDKGKRPPKIGTRICAEGKTWKDNLNHVMANCSKTTILGVSPAPVIDTITFVQALSGEYDFRIVKIRGMLRDFFRDEIDPHNLFLILNKDGKTLYAATTNITPENLQKLERLIGCELTLTGFCNPMPIGSRRKIGRIFEIVRYDDVPAVPMTAQNPFISPKIDNLTQIQSSDLTVSGRRRTAGKVLAVWQDHSLLVRTESGDISRVDLSKAPPPHYGDQIEIVGFPETDLYRINFTRAVWRRVNTTAEPADTPAFVSAEALMTCSYIGKPAINAEFHGRAICLRGTVRSLPSIGNDGRFYLESDGYTLPVDISANPVLAEKLEIGSVIDVTGVCVTDIENWRPNLVFPHIKEVIIVTRTPEDIVVVKRPPWWTPARLSIVIGSLLAVLIIILIWNRALKALAEKRGKALANEELERLESDLKVCERTRLAVELHDSIAQNLTGVSMEIDTALRGEEPLPPAAAQHMGRALRTIDSCRGELRNCLWDLRSQALEEDDMNKAIRLTLSRTIGKANLIVRFNVPRSRFTDNTAHTLLRIIRELAANAVRHGHATEIKVAGSIEDNVLKFSVRDNGCGFDPDTCPSVFDGHFGLQGIRERVASFEGTIDIQSEPGKGTKVMIAINAPQNDDWEKI